MDSESNLPCEIESVLDTRVHSLTASRAVNMRGIAGKEDSPKPEFADLAMSDVKARKPRRVAQPQALAGSPIYQGLHLGQSRFIRFRISLPILQGGDNAAVFWSKRKNSHDSVLRQE